ncbi:MAG: preprotein translocase subunit SecE [Gammaproteobacteria bacterium]|nr:preprotein translocase subunit SecE [Gammaproteobacteria bacterium]
MNTDFKMADKIKLLVATLLIIAGIAGFYYYSEQALLYRVLALLAVLGVSAFVALKTQAGMETWNYGRSAIVEVRKAVWPSRKETMQTTLMVMAMVIVVGLVLWLFDTFLLWAVKMITGQGG